MFISTSAKNYNLLNRQSKNNTQIHREKLWVSRTRQDTRQRINDKAGATMKKFAQQHNLHLFIKSGAAAIFLTCENASEVRLWQTEHAEAYVKLHHRHRPGDDNARIIGASSLKIASLSLRPILTPKCTQPHFMLYLLFANEL